MTGSTPRFRLVRTLMLAALLGTSAGAAQADTRFAFSGFGTLGYAVLDDPDAEYRVGDAVDGADDKGSFEVDTRLGLQLDAEFTPALSGTLQGLAREGNDGDPEPMLEWAFLRWLPNEAITLRAGRLALPVYALSDFREVGYANVLLRPPEDVYSQVPLRSIDGVDASAYTELGDTLLSAQLYAGQTDDDFYGDVELEARDMFGINLVAERGPLRVRLSHVSARIATSSTGLDQLHAGILAAAAFVPELDALADDFSGELTRSRFSALGLSLDFERLFVDAEYTQRRVAASPPDMDGWYVALGTRIRSFTPYVFTSALDGVEARRNGIELPDVPALAPLEAGLSQAVRSNDQATTGLGLRWDFAPNLAFKAQIERVSGERGEVGTSLQRSAGLTADPAGSGGDVVLTSVAIDFVF